MIKELKNVFTREYQENVAYLQFKYQMRSSVKLRNASESIDIKIERLQGNNYISNCEIEVGEFL